MTDFRGKKGKNRSCKFVTFTRAVFFYAEKGNGILVQHCSAKLTYIPLVVRLECVGPLKVNLIRRHKI